MALSPDIPWVTFNFLALTPEQSALGKARAVVLPVPYDSTTSYRTGSRYGPMAILQASSGLEDYDHELDLDVSSLGIHTTPFLEPHMAGPAQMVERIQKAVHEYASTGKIVGVLGVDVKADTEFKITSRILRTFLNTRKGSRCRT